MNDQIKFPNNFPMRLTGEEDIDKSQADIAEEIFSSVEKLKGR